jgi:Family of unknown function (DUF6504)
VAKRYEEAIEVTLDPGNPASPIGFSWRGRRYDIDQHLMTWRDAGEWWKGNAMREREYFRVLARPAGMLAIGDLDPDGCMHTVSAVYDVYRERGNGSWSLARLWD